MKKALVIGGTKGIGLSVAINLSKTYNIVTIIGRNKPALSLPENIIFKKINLLTDNLNWIEDFYDIDFLFYSAGIGRLALFNELNDIEIEKIFQINAVNIFRILSFYSSKIFSKETFYCGIMCSIAGRLSSPLFSVYSASKAAIFRGVESINAELSELGFENKICEISPGYIKGTSFYGDSTNLNELYRLSSEIIDAILDRLPFFIPNYDDTYKSVLKRYADNPIEFAHQSYNHKLENNRLKVKNRGTIGYLSGSFDLFHIGHLNLIKKAKENCDYLIVGVHKDGSHKNKKLFIPFEERKEIVRNIKFVDKVIDAEKEDDDVYLKNIVKYDKLFVGSDYLNTPRFKKYEDFFKDKNVEIVYFPYTQGTSSTDLRDKINNTSNM